MLESSITAFCAYVEQENRKERETAQVHSSKTCGQGGSEVWCGVVRRTDNLGCHALTSLSLFKSHALILVVFFFVLCFCWSSVLLLLQFVPCLWLPRMLMLPPTLQPFLPLPFALLFHFSLLSSLWTLWGYWSWCNAKCVRIAMAWMCVFLLPCDQAGYNHRDQAIRSSLGVTGFTYLLT